MYRLAMVKAASLASSSPEPAKRMPIAKQAPAIMLQ